MLAAAMVSCSHNHVYTVNNSGKTGSTATTDDYPIQTLPTKVRIPVQPTGGPVVNMMPNATAFRMSGDYYDNVAITLGPDGQLLYFPAPTDITADSKPIDLGNGWWLNNQGIGPNSVFTKYTFAQYAELPEVPDPAQLKNSIIPGAKVTGFIELPMKLDEANGNIEAVKEYLKNQ